MELIDISDETVARHYINGKFTDCLTTGKYPFWKVYRKHEFKIIDIKEPLVPDDLPKLIFDVLPNRLFVKVEVAGYQKARLYYDQKFMKLLNEGNYYFWNNGTKISFSLVDTRLLQMDIVGQEMLTIAKYRLDEILENREQIADYALQKLKEREENYYVTFFDAGVKDIILPGEIRDIMNTILIAEKKAQANVIARREEVASTRSLLNTAKLMDENQSLY